MINITINAETGAEARGALLELLGLTGQEITYTVKSEDSQIAFNRPEKTDVITGNGIHNGMHNGAELIETAVKKRRSKAEIEAEKAPVVETAPEETKPDEVPAETPAEITVTKEDLQKKAVELGRVGKKELCRAVLQKHGADSISTADKNPLKLELYAIVLEEFNKL